MREILFRGKASDGLKWIYGNYQKLKICGDIVHLIQPLEYDTYRAETIDKNTLGQYTGVKDKNGTKVFEGDLIKFTDRICEVHYRKDLMAFDFSYIRRLDGKETTKFDRCPENWEKHHTAEVIGNIHDNPELLK